MFVVVIHIVYILFNMTLFVRVKGFISLQSFVFVSTAVVELLDSPTICIAINNTLAEIVCCCFLMKYIVYIFLNMTRFVGS